MRRLSNSVRIALVSSLVLPFAVLRPAWAQDASATLQNAVQKFNDGDYLGAQDLLSGVDRSKLSPEEQARRDDYLSRVQTAIMMLEKAQRDLDDAQRAVQDGDAQQAAQLLDGVLANEYAPLKVRESAAALKLELQSAPRKSKEAGVAAVPEPTAERRSAEAPKQAAGESGPATRKNGATGIAPADVEKAKALTSEGNDMVRGARYDEAERLFKQALSLVPGYPEAVDGLRQVVRHRQNVAGPEVESLITVIRREDAINWQRAVAEYRDVESTIRDHVTNERFEEATQLLIRANQIVESARQFADPVTRYESLRSEADALSKSVAGAEREYNERKVGDIRRQIEEQRGERLRQDEENRRQQVDSLMAQAVQHKKDGDLDAAINVLKQVTVIDPKYREARWMMDDLEVLRAYRRGRDARDNFYKETQDSLNAVEEAKIPWSDLLIYPKNWNEITSRPERGGSSARHTAFMSALDSPVPIDFQQMPFDQVIEKLAASQNLNVIVKWHDLQRVGIAPNLPITLRVPNEISLKRALTEVLDQASGGTVELGFDVTDEAIMIASRETLDKNTHEVVYDINDLLMEIPNFNDAPMVDLTEANSRNVPPQTKPAASRPWAGSGDDDGEAAPADPDRARRVREIINLIEDAVAPASWRDRGGTIGNISEINGQLVITQTTAGQRAIGDLLGKLRDQRAIQIAVEARFITVSSHYLEQLGMDLNVVLNSGNAGYDYIPGANGVVTDPVLGNPLLLPRSFSRLGFTPATPALGVANTVNPAGGSTNQPYNQPYLVPQTSGTGNNMTPIPMSNRVSAFTDPANLGSDVPGSFAGQSLPPAMTIFGSFLDNIQVDFLIRATQADSRTTVLTAPQLVLFNGQRSWVAVTVQQNFVSQLNPVVATGAVAQAPQVGTIDSGAVLDVNATVTSDKRYVTMTIRPGVTRLLDLQTIPFSGGGSGGGFGGGPALAAFLQLPTLSSQRIQTTVSVPDGGTLLIGGQKLASETEVEAGVPILSKIPILKRAYSSRSMVKDEQTLLILIKPKIMIQSEQEELAFPSFSKR